MREQSGKKTESTPLNYSSLNSCAWGQAELADLAVREPGLREARGKTWAVGKAWQMEHK